MSVCSGIEAASVAWKNLGWKPTAFAEVEPFPSAVLAHHYPTVRNRGDMTKFTEWPDEAVDLLVGGTPCQSFSVAGLRKGLADPRGNLMLTYLGIAQVYRPRWIVWENVPGVLSSGGGRDFGTFLGALVDLGYGFAYRVLDAQWFGVAQRRKRVFVVGYLGNAECAAKVLFERESVQRNPAPSREKGQGIATNVADCLRSGGAGGVPSSRGEHLVVGSLDTECGGGKLTHQSIANGHIIDEWQSPNGKDVVGAMRARDYKGLGNDDLTEGRGLAIATTYDMKQHHNPQPSNTAQLTTKNCAFVRGDTPLMQTTSLAFEPGIAGREGGESRFTNEVTGTLRKDMGDNQTAVAIGTDCYNGAITGDVTATVTSSTGSSATHSGPTVMHSTAVRRLTPTECERLQGFPDGYTNIPWRKKTESPDGPRYKALGNSMAVPVMRWIGNRIDKVNKGESL